MPGRSSRDHASSETRRNAREKGIGKNSYLCRHLDPSRGVRCDPASASACVESVNDGGRTTGRTCHGGGHGRGHGHDG
eukprot:1673418-Rhodomonas_salina.1